MFPQFDFNMDEFINEQNQQLVEDTKLGLVPKFNFKTKSYEIADGKTVYCTEIESVEQWIEMCIRTPLNRFKCYEGQEFGNNAYYLIINKKDLPKDVVMGQISQELTEMILTHKSVTNVIDFNVNVVNGVAEIAFAVETTLGQIEGSVTVDGI